MVGTLSNDCFNIILSQAGIILDIESGNNNDKICDYLLEVDYNCCGKKTYAIRALHDFEAIVSGCGTETINAIQYGYFNLTFNTTLDTDCIELYKYQTLSSSASLTDVSYPTTFAFKFSFPIATTDTTCAVEFTTVNGVTYVVEIVLAGIDMLQPCNTAVTLTTNATYPPMPPNTGIVHDTINNEIDLNSITFGQTAFTTSNTLLGGVYCVTLKGVNHDGVPLVTGGLTGQQLYSESITKFVDCGNIIKCQITALAATCESVDAIWIYEALIHNNTCQVLTCNDVCNLYRKLKSFIDNNCLTPAKPCNCS